MELISKVSAHPEHKGDFRTVTEKVASSEISDDEIMDRLRKVKHVKLFLDELNGQAALYSVGMTGFPQDDEKAARLFALASRIEKKYNFQE